MVTEREVKRLPMEEGAGENWSLSLEDLERAFPFFTAVGPEEVEVAPVGGGFGKEVVAIPELFEIKELVFDEAVDGFDIALPGVALGRNEAVI